MRTKKKIKKRTLKKYLGGASPRRSSSRKSTSRENTMLRSSSRKSTSRKRTFDNFGIVPKTRIESNRSNVSERSFNKEASFPQQLFMGTYKAIPEPTNSINEKFWENNYVRQRQYEYIQSQSDLRDNSGIDRDTLIKKCYKYLVGKFNQSERIPTSKRLKSMMNGPEEIKKIKTHCLKLYNIAAPKGLGDISPWIMDFMVITRGNRIKLTREGILAHTLDEFIHFQDTNFNNTYSTENELIKNPLLRMAYKESHPILEDIEPSKISCLGANDLEPKPLLFAGYQLVENSQGCFMMTKYMGYALILINELIQKYPEKDNISPVNFIQHYELVFYLDNDGILRVQYQLEGKQPINRRISVACKTLLSSNIKNYVLSDVKIICTIFNLALSAVSMDKIIGMLAIVGSTLTHDLDLELENQKKMTLELLKMIIFPNLKKLEDVLPFNPIKNNTLEDSAVNLFVLDVNVLNFYKMTTLADIIPIDSVNCSGLVMTIAASVEAVNVNNKVAGFGHETRGAFATQKVLVADIWNKEPNNNIKGLWMNAQSNYLPDCLNLDPTISPIIMLYVPTKNGIENVPKDQLLNRLKKFFGNNIQKFINTFFEQATYNKYNETEIYIETKNLKDNIHLRKNLILTQNAVDMINLIVEYKGNPPDELVHKIMVPYVEINDYAEVLDNREILNDIKKDPGNEVEVNIYRERYGEKMIQLEDKGSNYRERSRNDSL